MSTGDAEVAVVGGGVIGLAVAWRCAQRGLAVTVYEAEQPAAWQVAAGMLAPVSEAYFGEEQLTTLLVAAAGQWEEFAAELAPFGDVGYATEGTLLVALTADDLAEAERLWTFQRSLGLPVERLTASRLRQREPALHPRVRGGAFALEDRQVDPRRLVPALRAAAAAAGVRFRPEPVTDLTTLDGTVVVAAGCGSAALTGLPVRPVKGQVLRLRAPDNGLGFRHVIRGFADGRRVYLVPRSDGEVVVGATEEERTDSAPTAGAALELLWAATDLVPELREYELVEVSVGHRPGTPDNAPLLGQLSTNEGRAVIAATGHYRHGILLTPLTAAAISELVATGRPPEAIVPFGPERFDRPTRNEGGQTQ
jgi:glycine oxidase